MAVKRQLKRIAASVLAPLAPLAWSRRPAPRLLVLMYHRVLPPEHPDRAIEQPGMYVSPATLDMHLTTLKRHFPIVHLDDWVRSAARGEAPPQACALTFDDGWRDNFDHAFPVLRRHEAPATIFLVSAMTGTNQDFWPNRLARLLSQLPPGAVLPESLEKALAPVLAHARSAGTWSLEDLDRAVVLAKQVGEAQIEAALAEAEAQARARTPALHAQADAGPTSDSERAVLNEDEVALMAASGLVRFGSHTRTHYRFRGEVAPNVLEREIGGSRVEIAAAAGAATADVFCYPNGDTTPAAVECVGRHYAAAVTTEKGWHDPSANRFLIRRIGVHEDISDRPAAFLARISGLM
jgi:peptidoglycan/xylan/chitin deacetylase (PgdA/CDA1 family)